MSIDTLLTRYELTARAEGSSPKTIDHAELAMRLSANFMGGIQDVRKVKADDLRHFIVTLQQSRKGTGHSCIT
jgi:hypothetical protein